MKKIMTIMAGAFLAVGMTSCEIFGLDYSTSEDYEPKSPSNTTGHINMTCWEFIQSRPDIFSDMMDAIEYAGIQDLYSERGNTYILLTNAALTTDATQSYWKRELITDGSSKRAAKSWDEYDRNKISEMLRYHIVKGEYSYHNLSDVPVWGKTYGNGTFEYVRNGETLQGDTAVVSLELGHDSNIPMQLNNGTWHYRGKLSGSTASCRSTNIRALNGYIHVSDYYLERPTKKVLGLE